MLYLTVLYRKGLKSRINFKIYALNGYLYIYLSKSSINPLNLSGSLSD